MKSTFFAPSAFAVAVLAGLFADSAFALPLAGAQENAALKFAPEATDLTELSAGGVDFTAIVALSDCSGALVRFSTSNPDDKALVLTNGHCYEDGFIDPGEVIQNKASSRSFRLLSSNGSSTLATLRASKVLYATMTDTDVTLYSLTTTYADIQSRYGVQALTISDTHPVAGDPIRVVSGYWKKIYSCTVDDFVYELKEADWTFRDSIRYKQPGCETIGGTSGSPIIQADTREVVGINNTINKSGGRCTMDNPCEVNENGQVTVTKGAAYGQELYNFYGCLSDDNGIDLNKAGCNLPKPSH